MSIFQAEKTFTVSCADLAPVGRAVMEHFRGQGFEVTGEQGITQSWHISLTKGNLFQAVLGMKTALNITIDPTAAGIHAKAGIGIFGQQAIPTVISMFFFWPVLIPQIWGLVQQHKLDEEAMTVIEQALQTHTAITSPSGTFCTECGKPMPAQAKFCPECGKTTAPVGV